MGYFKVIVSLYTFINIGIPSSTTLDSISLFKYSVTKFSPISIVRKKCSDVFNGLHFMFSCLSCNPGSMACHPCEFN